MTLFKLTVAALVLTLAGCKKDGLNQRTAEGHSLCFRDISGQEHRPFARGDCRAVVFLFVLQDCPIANGYAPEIERLHEEYRQRGAAFFLVHADPGLRLAEAREHAAAYGLRLPVVLDPFHDLARFAGATRAPEAAVFTPDGQLVYRGRIDDRYADFGKLRVRPTRHDLRDALDSSLADRPVPRPWPEPVGCFIPGI